MIAPRKTRTRQHGGKPSKRKIKVATQELFWAETTTLCTGDAVLFPA